MLENPTNPATTERVKRRSISADMVPLAPTTPTEMAEGWQIPAALVDSCSVKVFRCIEGTKQRELVGSMPVTRYDLAQIAGEFGPGKYLVCGSGRPISTRNATILVSDHLAAANGWGKLPEAQRVPEAYQAKAMETVNRAVELGVNPVDLAAMIQTAVDGALSKQPKAPDPMDQMRSMVSMFGMMNELRESARGLVDLAPAAPATGSTMADLIREMMPAVLPLVPQLIAALRPAPPALPARPTLPNAREKAAPALEAPSMPKIELNPTDQKLVGQAVMMLRPFLPMLRRMEAAMQDKSSADVAGDLIQWIPSGVFGAVVRLAELTKEHGPQLLAQLLAPEMGTPRWAEIVEELAAIILEAFKEDEPEGAHVE